MIWVQLGCPIQNIPQWCAAVRRGTTDDYLAIQLVLRWVDSVIETKHPCALVFPWDVLQGLAGVVHDLIPRGVLEIIQHGIGPISLVHLWHNSHQAEDPLGLQTCPQGHCEFHAISCLETWNRARTYVFPAGLKLLRFMALPKHLQV